MSCSAERSANETRANFPERKFQTQKTKTQESRQCGTIKESDNTP